MGDRTNAVAMFNAAVNAANDKTQQGHLERAYQLFASATLVDPTFGQAHFQMGNNNADIKRIPAAIASWRRALECENTPAERAKTLTNMGWFLHTLGQIDEALECTQEATQLAPSESPAWSNLSAILMLHDRGEEAIVAARKAFELDPQNTQNEIALAFTLMHNHQFAEGLKHFERRFEWRLHQYMHSPYPRWEGQEGGTLLLLSDQGLGDTLSFARFVEEAARRCKYIHASVHPELMRLFSHAFLHIKNINLVPQPSPFPQADYWSTFMSLPAAMKLTDTQILNQPHIDAGLFGGMSNWKVPDRKLHIGIAWRGNALSDIDRYRSIPLEQFLELYRVPGIQLYGLQADQGAQDIYDHGCSAIVRDLKPYIRDVTDTIGMLAHLDLVICLESALGHICGLADKECWIPYSLMGRDYRAGLRGDRPIWYGKHRFFRQEKGETWQPVFERINQALREKLCARAK